MSDSSGRGAIVWWLAGIFVLAAIITITIFHAFVPPENWGATFYIWMTAILGGEFVFFAWLANYGLRRRFGPGRNDGAVLLSIHGMILGWLLIGIALAVVAGASGFGWRLSLVYAALTFFLLFGASALYINNLRTLAEDRAALAQRVDLQVRASDIEQAARDLRAWGTENRAHLGDAERVAKKLDAARTSLDFAPPGKPGTLEEGQARGVADLNAQIGVAIGRLTADLRQLRTAPADPAAGLRALDAGSEELDSLLRQRQQRLLIGG